MRGGAAGGIAAVVCASRRLTIYFHYDFKWQIVLYLYRRAIEANEKIRSQTQGDGPVSDQPRESGKSWRRYWLSSLYTPLFCGNRHTYEYACQLAPPQKTRRSSLSEVPHVSVVAQQSSLRPSARSQGPTALPGPQAAANEEQAMNDVSPGTIVVATPPVHSTQLLLSRIHDGDSAACEELVRRVLPLFQRWAG